MSEYIDVMALLPAEAPCFTVDTTPGVLSVDLTTPTHVPHYDYHLHGAGGKKTFQAGDNFTVLSAGFVLPESFIMASTPDNDKQNNPSLSIGAEPIGGSVYFLPNFSVDGILMPMENYEIPVNIFVDIYNLASPSFPFRTTNYRLMCTFRIYNPAPAMYPQVSMVGVPTALDTKVQHLTVFVKVLHTMPLV